MDYTPLITVIKAALITNIIPEYLISMILSPHVALGVRRGLGLGIEGNNRKLAAQQQETNAAVEGNPTQDKESEQ